MTEMQRQCATNLRCQDVQRQMIQENIYVKCSLVYNREIIKEYSRENYVYCNRVKGVGWLGSELGFGS